MTEDVGQLTEIITVRVTKRDAEILKAGAARARIGSLGKYVREIVLESFAVPTDKTLLLEAILQLDFRIAGYLNEASGGHMVAANLDKVRAASQVASRALLTRFMSSREEV